MKSKKIIVKAKDFICALENINLYYKRNKNLQIILFWNEKNLIVGIDTKDFLAMQKMNAKSNDIKDNYKTNYDIFYYQLFVGIIRLHDIIPEDTMIRLEFMNSNEVKIYSEADNKLLQILKTYKKEIHDNLTPSNNKLFIQFLDNIVYNNPDKFMLSTRLHYKYLYHYIRTYGYKNFIKKPEKKNKNKKESVISAFINLYINRYDCEDAIITTNYGDNALIIGNKDVNITEYTRLIMPASLLPLLTEILYDSDTSYSCIRSDIDANNTCMDIDNTVRIIHDNQANYPDIIKYKKSGMFQDKETWKKLDIKIKDLDKLISYINTAYNMTKDYHNNRIFTKITTINNDEIQVNSYYETTYNTIEEFKILDNKDKIFKIHNPKNENINMLFNTRILYYYLRFLMLVHYSGLNYENFTILRNRDSSFIMLYEHNIIWNILLGRNFDHITIKEKGKNNEK